ncbi:unnamed protein product [Linum tenue]|uniref:Uncharacterized protein n=1 Tax=Linum tenue TaxID=586396 RepID=A0AAV0QCP6_9ROSI|nr:unnamed protein product [Linum tenue]
MLSLSSIIGVTTTATTVIITASCEWSVPNRWRFISGMWCLLSIYLSLA